MPEAAETGSFPESEEHAIAAETKRAADISRLPPGTQVRLRLRNGDVLTGTKSDFGADGVLIDGYGFTPFRDVAHFETVRDAQRMPGRPA